MASPLLNHLTLNLQTRELSYKAYKDPNVDASSLVKLRAAVVCLIAYPIIFVVGLIGIGVFTSEYFTEKRNQERMIEVLTNGENLSQYAKETALRSEEQINKLKSDAWFIMEHELRDPDQLDISIPKRESFWDGISQKVATGKSDEERASERWKDFSWDNFLKADFSQKLESVNSSDKINLGWLIKNQIQINCLLKQRAILTTPGEHLEVIKKIAEMSFVKSAFNRQNSKKIILLCIAALIPLGLLFKIYFNRPNDRLIYEGNKDFLPKETALADYDDLVAAHNSLAKNDFLAPFLFGPVFKET